MYKLKNTRVMNENIFYNKRARDKWRKRCLFITDISTIIFMHEQIKCLLYILILNFAESPFCLNSFI